jgi:hypothetical protein
VAALRTDTPMERILAALDFYGCRIRLSGTGCLAQCPAHEDLSPSLSIREGHDGRVLVHCFGGCDTRDVLRALGLEFRDLFPAPPPRWSRWGGKVR